LYNVKNQWFPIKQKGKGYEFAVIPKINGTVKNVGSERTDALQEKEMSQDKLQRAKSFKLTFGKYTGKTLEEIYDSDKKYFQYIIEQSKDPSLVNACKYLKNNLLN